MWGLVFLVASPHIFLLFFCIFMTLTEALTLALESELGVVVETPEPRSTMARLRVEIHNNKSLYGSLTAVPAPSAPDSEVWIIRNANKE